MVLCVYFLNNNCRFGSRCNNEHIDIGSIVKSEIDVTIKGNQWPLSCFGPFKERNCIPNFIDDHSFEEIRMMYLEAKMQNNIPAHQMQLAQMINDAKTKLQWLTTMNRDILSSLVELYNQQESSVKAPSAPMNPFASIGTGNSNASNIFGNANSGNAFGAGFGSASATSTTATAGSIFGGGSISGQTTQSSGNIFGSVPTTTSSIFAKPNQPPAGGNIFGMNQQLAMNAFGGPAVIGGSMFGSVQQPATQNTTGMFGAVAATPNSSAGGNIFGSAPQNTNTFGQQPTNTGFAGSGMFGNSAPATAPSVGGFGAAVPQPQHGAGMFNSVPFGANQSNASFGQFGSMMQAPATASNPPSQSLFVPAPSSTPFGGSMGTNSFGAPVQPAAIPQSVPISVTMYSAMENVTPEQLAAFNADKFQLGRIPTIPPPKELCH
ncbi:nuclear pore complex protein Nup98-Nup96-like [Anopheles nili]|uniref:nuclear pore complex protein Nup98-Nup96-like n=1 Tax=Anopheles nili TaxID=185578 RepID=UPI00237C2DD7|nr:nuclear pore complex protein Nup98-Nup96-like [Anopheles nili]